MNGRPQLLIALGAGMLGVPLITPAQQKVYRVGVLISDSPETRGPSIDVFMRAMRETGYVEGRNIVYESRYARGDVSRLSAYAAELAALNLDLIVAPNGPAVDAVARAVEEVRRPVPIVFAGCWATPLSSGLVASLARPGGNVTGVTNVGIELAGKQLQLLKDAYPKIARLAAFVDLTHSRLVTYYLREIKSAARGMGMPTLGVEARGADAAERCVALLRQWRADSIFVATNPLNFSIRKLLVQIAQVTRLPAIYGNDVFVDAGD